MDAQPQQRQKVRIMIVDDHPIIRRGLAEVITAEPDMELCSEADNSEDALRLAREFEPDLALVDICLPGESGLVLIERLSTQCRTLALSMYDENLYAERALHAGACAYVGKYQPVGKLLATIRGAYSGSLDERHDRRCVRCRSRLPNESPMMALSNREIEVFRLVGEGMSTRQIAAMLHVSHKTIETHRENIKKKFGIKSASELLIRASGWVLSQGGGATSSSA
jgi:DNA-binding NarL/FixJ family response regulator